ncbi:Aminoacyl-tRNA synthetase, class II (D/K/N)-like protein [Ophiocordyceps sinensis CO18]|uniref:Aminoacyl-tRNA synthetase, class II (D/K/N)-like protein n=1 Tax=Ophiocordyceps sinensis (strain Co18 / CGMCC 3.14243) TaxID=911162 RepID=T5APP4_OPHSC|nr:Aminoacyl-tRNA synthetase, class II (D/K/N)-like protein [Ophiocordyceps sinensis CO18]
MPPASCRASRLLPLSPTRRYSVRIPGESQLSIKTVADLKAWAPHANVPGVEVCGWVRSVRKSSAVRFVDVTDGSSMRPVQAVVDKKQSTDLRIGVAVRLRGTWYNAKNPPTREANVSSAPSPPSSAEPGEPPSRASDSHPDADATRPMHELQVNHVDILASSDPQVSLVYFRPLQGLAQPNPSVYKTYSIQNKYQTPESLRTISHLRSRTPVNSTLLRLRSDATAVLTRFFSQEKFQQTHPPIITSSDCEGAGEAFAVEAGGRADFFRDAKYLTVSTQLHLEALAQALGNVWTLSPTFRAEKSDTSRHLSEFYMLEAEMSFVQDMDQVMDLVQSMMTFLASELKQLNAAKELERNRLDSRDPVESLALADLVDPEELARRWRGLSMPTRWPRITYTEAMERLQPVAVQFKHKPVWGGGLQSEHEKYLAEQVGYNKAEDAYVPIFVTRFPREIKAFYMLQSDSPPAQGETVDCFDLLVPGLGELAGGSMREHRLPQLQHETSRAAGADSQQGNRK